MRRTRPRGATERGNIKKETSPFRAGLFLRVCVLLESVLVRNCEFLAAMTATGRKHAATVGSAHALAETVLVDTFVNVGLECPFHCMLFYIFVLE